VVYFKILLRHGDDLRRTGQVCHQDEELVMVDTTRFTIICPCCEATLTVDAQTGALISHEEKAKPVASFDEMLKGLDKQKQHREQLFQQELGSLKDRERLLEEKFRDAMKRAEKDKDKPYINPLDVD
jgi:ribosome-associated translation inhibitor RaiA